MSSEKRIIGFDRKVQLDWLNAMATWAAEGRTPQEIRERSDALLAGKVAGTKFNSALGKTKTVLLHIWVTVPDGLRPLRDRGIELLGRCPENGRFALHWGMAIATYPFFRDVAVATGRLLAVQGTVALSQVTRRLAEGWGERSTLGRAVRRIIRCFVEWGVLRETDDRGVLIPAAKLAITDQRELGVWLLEASLSTSGSCTAAFQQLLTDPALFPFSLGLSPRDLKNSNLEVVRHGLDQDLVLLKKPRG